MSITVTCVTAMTELCGFLQAERKMFAAKRNMKNAASRLRIKPASVIEPIVFLQDGAKFFMIECDDFVTVDSRHRIRSDHRVDNRFFGRLHGGGKKRVDLLI